MTTPQHISDGGRTRDPLATVPTSPSPALPGGPSGEVDEITLLIETTEHGRQPVRGWHLTRDLPGLVLHRQFQRETHWRVSHIASGRCLDENLTFPTAVEATQFMAWLAHGAPVPPGDRRLEVDWTLRMDELQERHPNLRREIKARVKRWLDRRRMREQRRQARVIDNLARSA